MAKDSTKLSHPDYVSGVAGRNAVRGLALRSAPPVADSRAARRANMTAFRDAQFRTAKTEALRLAFTSLPPEPEIRPVAHTKVLSPERQRRLDLAKQGANLRVQHAIGERIAARAMLEVAALRPVDACETSRMVAHLRRFAHCNATR